MQQRSLDQIARDALQLERINPPAAALIWREALAQLSPDSPQYSQVVQRIGALAAGWMPNQPPKPSAGPWSVGQAEVTYGRPVIPYEPRVVRPPDPWPLALVKTVGSMLLSIVVYYLMLFHSVPIAIGFVVLMLVHELGHVIAMRYYGLSASPPIFIPFVGALINLRQQPPNALVESVVGIGGPFLGTLGAIVCYGAAHWIHEPNLRSALLIVAQLAFMLNLFNLLPVPPLDGGRVTAAISPWIWIAGLAVLGLMILLYVISGEVFGIVILGFLLMYAIPRIRFTLRARGMHLPYYNVPKSASWTMAIIYVGLGIVLALLFVHNGAWARLRGF